MKREGGGLSREHAVGTSPTGRVSAPAHCLGYVSYRLAKENVKKHGNVGDGPSLPLHVVKRWKATDKKRDNTADIRPLGCVCSTPAPMLLGTVLLFGVECSEQHS